MEEKFDVGLVECLTLDGEAIKLLLLDRFGSTFVIKRYIEGITYLDPKQFRGQNVLIAGWCPPQVELLLLFAREAKHVTIIDHHPTSMVIALTPNLPHNITFRINITRSSSRTEVFQLLQKDVPCPRWLEDNSNPAIHAALIDDLSALDPQRNKSFDELLQHGRYLVEKQWPAIAATILKKIDYQESKGLRIAYVEPSHAKFIDVINNLFWSDQPNVDILALRFTLPGNRTNFKLRQSPNSKLDLGNFAQMYGGTVEIVLDGTIKYLPPSLSHPLHK